MTNFALIGVAGFIAVRHLDAIRDIGGRLLAAVDPHDSVAILDAYSFDVKYFREIERFERFLERTRRGPEDGRVHYVSICSPNYLHDAHVRLALRAGAHAICEKPLVINPWNLDALEELEQETGRRIHTVLQLRHHPSLRRLHDQLRGDRRHDVEMTYVAARGGWYDISWKGSEERSGGVATNIGIHFFDLLLWLFGGVNRCEVHLRDRRRLAGYLELDRADVRWFLSVDPSDLPFTPLPGSRTTHRSISVDGREIEFADASGELHTAVYRDAVSGEGFGVADARPAIELVHRIRTATLTSNPMSVHRSAATPR